MVPDILKEQLGFADVGVMTPCNIIRREDGIDSSRVAAEVGRQAKIEG